MSGPCFVYLLAAAGPTPEGPVKVGISQNVQARLRELQTACPYKISLVHQFEFPERWMAADVERGFHAVQKKHRLAGEWFKLNPVIALQLLSLSIEVVFHVKMEGRGKDFIEQCREMAGLNSAISKIKGWNIKPYSELVQ